MSFSKRLKNCRDEFIFISFFNFFSFDKIFIELINSMEKMNFNENRFFRNQNETFKCMVQIFLRFPTVLRH